MFVFSRFILYIEHLIADEFSAELSEGIAYVAGYDEENKPVLVITSLLLLSIFPKKIHDMIVKRESERLRTIAVPPFLQIFRIKQDYQKFHSQKLWVQA